MIYNISVMVYGQYNIFLFNQNTRIDIAGILLEKLD